MDLNSSLSASDCLLSSGFQSLLETTIHDTTLYSWYSLEDNYVQVTRPLIASLCSFPNSLSVQSQLYELAKQRQVKYDRTCFSGTLLVRRRFQSMTSKQNVDQNNENSMSREDAPGKAMYGSWVPVDRPSISMEGKEASKALGLVRSIIEKETAEIWHHLITAYNTLSQQLGSHSTLLHRDKYPFFMLVLCILDIH